MNLPEINAILNSASAILLACGYVMIRQGKRETHRKFMIAAFACSVLFLICYLIHHYRIGSKHFPYEGTIRTVYLTILLTHTVLAAAVPVLAVITLRRGLAARFADHRKIARWTFPIWMYVNVTGVVVYWMLYRM